MNEPILTTRSWWQEVSNGWNRFWFSATDPATLGLIRLLGGLMIFYTHLVWTKDLEAFFGPDAWISIDAVSAWQGEGNFCLSYLKYIDSMTLLWTVHIAALVVLLMFALGLFTRVTSILAFVITMSYVHRLPGALFGLDQVNTMLVTYLMIGPSGAAFSLDRLIARRKSKLQNETTNQTSSQQVTHLVGANLAIRLIQVHMCIIYMYSGISKLLGEPWWDGTALWGAAANLEYQSLDLTWMAGYPMLVALLTHITIFWETFYCALVWPRVSRPFVLATAVGVHLGIACCMGMITFGLAMIIGNMAFIRPQLIRRLLGVFSGKTG